MGSLCGCLWMANLERDSFWALLLGEIGSSTHKGSGAMGPDEGLRLTKGTLMA